MSHKFTDITLINIIATKTYLPLVTIFLTPNLLPTNSLQVN